MSKFFYKLSLTIFLIFLIFILNENVSMGKYIIEENKSLSINIEIKHHFITEWTIPADNTTIVLPITQTPNITVDWGDGTVEDITTPSPTHIYTTAGKYDIKIIGDLPDWNFESVATSKDYITQIKQWGEVGFQNLTGAFFNCKNITGNIPTPSKNSFTETTDFSYALYGCSGLSGEIPDNLFSSCTNVTEIEYIFYGCSGLEGNIPENLFANCSYLDNFSGIFGKCYNLTGGIPENLFANCTKAVSFKSTFYCCSGITESIPEKLFADCSNASIFTYTFLGCDGLTGSISTDLFKYTQAADFTSTFAGCTGITSVYINTSFIGEWMFQECNNLTNITITDNVESIGNKAFHLSNAIDNITNLITNNPIAINYNWEINKRTIQVLPLEN